MRVPPQYISLQYLHQIKWCDIFAVWRSDEALQREWEKHWHDRGFVSWDAWRKDNVAPLKPERREWYIYRLSQPVHDVPLMLWCAFTWMARKML